MPCNLRILSNTWKKYNPDWDYHLWCSAEVESLLFSDFSDFYLLYKSVFTQRQRLNLAKYMILYLHGGLYVNLDTDVSNQYRHYSTTLNYFSLTNQKDIVIC